MSVKNFLTNHISKVILTTLVVGFLIGFFSNNKTKTTTQENGESKSEKKSTKWYCSMDPQIVRDGKGSCPICGMDLVPMPENLGQEGPRELSLSENAIKLAGIVTAEVERKWVAKEIRMVGKVDYDETRLGYITSWIPGRLDRLYVDYTGVPVKKGDHLVYLYSPELLTAQEELIRALEHHNTTQSESGKLLAKTTLEASREKLRLWGLTKEQIQDIEKNKTATDHLTIYASMGGIVIHKNALQGMYVKTGTRIYTIADLSQVWVKLDAYESDLSWLRYGQEVEFSTESYPGEFFSGRVAFIAPMLNEKTRTIKIRVNVPNLEEKLKPGMFVRAIVRSTLSRSGKAMDASFVHQWLCPMHHDQISDSSSDCNICEMPMVKAEDVYPSAPRSKIAPLVIPVSAPLITGKRAVVYVKVPDKEAPTFEGRQIILGPKTKDFYIVKAGLKKGEQVVVHGNFKIDSSLQILAKTSMMSDLEDSLTEPIEVPDHLLKKLSSLYNAYFKLQMALAKDDFKASQNAIEELELLIEPFKDEKLGTLEFQKKWEKMFHSFANIIQQCKESKDIKQLRISFKPLSDQFILLIQQVGHVGKKFYLAYCPMAFDDKGAYWLQDQEDTIWNSFFGDMMLHCGVIKETYDPLMKNPKVKTPKKFQEQLSKLFQPYFSIHKALSQDHKDHAKHSYHKFGLLLKEVQMSLLKDKAQHQSWMKELASLKKLLEAVQNSSSLSEYRSSFAVLSKVMESILETFEVDISESFYLYKCSMAFDNRGAIWLQPSEGTQNPYYGSEMSKCGKLLKTYK